jgi:hypothetical protein
MADFKLGRLKFVWKGNWATATAYVKDDIVRYGGNAFVVESAHTSGTFATDLAANRLTKIAGGTEYKGDWTTSTAYKVDDLVTYNGTVYRANQDHTAAGSFLTDESKWNVYTKGFSYRGNWATTTTYALNDVARVGGYLYQVTDAHVSQSTFNADSSKWTLFLQGIDFQSTWTTATLYQPGDIVKFGGYLYIANTEHTSSGTKINTTNFDVLLEGQKNAGTWASSGNVYKTGDVVGYGARSYICIQTHDQATDTAPNPPGPAIPIIPTNTNYWSLLNKGLDYKGAWSSSDIYKLDDVVEYSGSSYVCIQAHSASAGLPPNTATAYWNLLSQGDISSPMTNTGDMIYRNSGGSIVRLPVGASGSFLVVNNGIPSWGIQSPEDNYYVALTGNDSNDGRTPATAWRTIQHAATQTYNSGQSKISLFSGEYSELCPIKLGRGVCLEGDALGSVTIKPDTTTDKGYGVGISKDGSTPNANSDVFHVNNASRVRNIQFKDFGAGAVCVSLDPGYGPNDTSVWVTSQSPYVQNCTSFTNGGTGMVIDGALHNGGYKSIVANDWTQINSDGIGVLAKNDGRTELVSCFTYYCYIGYKAETGGKIRAVQGSSAYGDYGAYATGFSQNEIPLTGNIRLPSATVNSLQTVSDNAIINSHYIDEDKNVYQIGFTNPIINISEVDSTQISSVPVVNNAASEMFIAKYDTGSNLDWQSTFTGLYGELTCATDILGVVYTGGRIYQSGSWKGFIMKISSSGDIQWQKIITGADSVTAITTDGTSIYFTGTTTSGSTGAYVSAIGAGGASLIWTKALDFNDSSQLNTVRPTAIVYASEPTTSEDTYAAAGDIDAESKLFVALKDDTNNATFIARLTITGVFETSYNYGQNFEFKHLWLDTGNGDGIYMLGAGKALNAGYTYALTTLTYGASINATYASLSAGTGNSGADQLVLNGSGSSDLNQQGDVIKTRKILGVSSGATATIVSYDGATAGLIKISIQNRVGSFTPGEQLQLYQASVYQPFLARITMGGAVAWQHRVDAIDGGEFNYGFAQGNDVYAAGYVIDDINTDIRRSGFLTRFASNGTLAWQRSVSNATNYSELRGIGLDGVNVVSSGYIDGNDALYLNTDRSGTTFGSVAGYTWTTTTLTTSAPTIALRTIQALYNQTVTFTIADSATVADQSPSTTSAVVATRSGFSGLGRGITFAVDNVIREPKKGSVFHINGNENTYFIIDVTAYDSGTDQATITLDPPIVSSLIPTDNESVTIREAYSQVRMTGHDFLDIGTGNFAETNYPVIIAADYTIQPDPDKEIFEADGGRCFYVTTDQDGNFRVGPYFKVEQATGRATLSSEEFDLTGLNELQLGSIRAGKRGATISEFSTDGTMAGNSDSVVPTEKALVTYVTTQLASGAAQGYKLKDANDNTSINVDTAGNGSADTIVMTTAGSTRLTVHSSGQITAASTYAPSGTYDLVTKTYVDTALAGLSQNSISQLNTNLTVTDSGTGSISATVDGTSRLTIDATGITANGVNFVGALTGNASTVTNGVYTTGDQTIAGTKTFSGSIVASNTISGSINGNAATATYASAVTLTADNSTNATNYPLFVNAATGNLSPRTDTGFTYNPSTGELTSVLVTASSDERFKTDIETITSALNKVLQLRGVMFTRTENGNREMGVIAQEVERIISEVVTTNSEGFKNVAYGNIVGLLIEAIKEQQTQIDYLKTKVE